MAQQTFDSTSLDQWHTEAWAGNGFTADDLSSFMASPNAVPGGNPFSSDSGGLHISSFNAPSGTDPASIDYKPNIGGELTTRDTFSQTYGYFEMTAKLSGVSGTNSAFWMMPANGGWPPEIDVVEVVGGAPTTLVNTAHSATDGTTPRWSEVSNMTQGFHTYGVDWEPDKITWYFDGKAMQSQATPSDMHQPMYLVLSEEAGTSGAWGGQPNANYHATMDVASVRAYSSFPGSSSNATATFSSNNSNGSGSSSSDGTSDTSSTNNSNPNNSSSSDTTSASTSATTDSSKTDSTSPTSTSSSSSDGNSTTSTHDSSLATITPETVGADSIVTSSAGGMEFVYSHNNQTSTIPEFDPSKDAIDFQNTRASFDSIHIAADPNDGHAVIYANHNVVNVMGVAPDQLNSSNVLFNIATH